MLILVEKVYLVLYMLYQDDDNVIPKISLMILYVIPRSWWVSALLPIEYDIVIVDLNDMNRILVKLNWRFDVILQL